MADEKEESGDIRNAAKSEKNRIRLPTNIQGNAVPRGIRAVAAGQR